MMAKKVLSLEERLKSHGKHVTDGRDQTSREIIPLEDRVTAIRGCDPNKYEAESRETAPFMTRRGPACIGWFLDPSPLVDMLISSAEMPLDQMFYGEELKKLESILCGEIQKDASLTYLDAVCFIADEWEETMKMTNRRYWFSSEGFSIDELSDDAFSVWMSLWEVILDVAKHRVNPDEERLGENLDISASFPAVRMPLPQLYQAADECCPDALREGKMYRMDRRFNSLFRIVQENSNELHFLWSKQPVIDTTYMDLASTVYLATLAKNEKWIHEDERDQYLYDLLITPFLTVRDIHRAEQAETM